MDYDEIIKKLKLLIKEKQKQILTEDTIEALEEAIKIIEDVQTL